MVRLVDGTIIGIRHYTFTNRENGEAVPLVGVCVGVPLTGPNERGIMGVNANVTARAWEKLGLGLDDNVRVCRTSDKWELVSDG